MASLDEAYRLLYASYSAEVIVRGAGGGRTMQPDAGTTQAVAQVARALWPGGKKPGLMLCGTVGNGKTTMLRAYSVHATGCGSRGAYRPTWRRTTLTRWWCSLPRT